MLLTQHPARRTAALNLLSRSRTFPRATILALSALVLVGALGAVARSASAAALDGRLQALQARLTSPAEMDKAIQSLPDGLVSMFVDGDVDASEVQALGGTLGSQGGRYRTVRIPATQLSRFLAFKGLQGAQLARPTEYQMYQSVPSTNAPALWRGSNGVYSGLTGKGIIVGIVDSGIDFHHKDFKNTDGTTRLISIWDQTVNLVPPVGFTYGAEWLPVQINAGLCTQVDGVGHGTFMASIAAGNGRGTGNGLPAYQYVGMAPEADIIAVKAQPMDVYLVDGVQYIFQKAQLLGKPAVVLIASGVRQGPHDGTDASELRLSSLCTTYGPSRLVVAATGNYGNLPIHASATVQKGSTAAVTFRIPTGMSQTGSPNMTVDGWYNAGHSYSVSVKTPNGFTVGPVAKGGYTDISNTDAMVIIANGTTVNSKGDPNISITLFPGSNGPLALGAYTINVTTNDASSGPVDFWLGDYYLNSIVPAFEQGVNYDRTAVTPSTADSVISVGAFTFRNSWTAAGNQLYQLGGAPTIGDIAAWSGRGMRRDGRLMPDLTAPGQAIGGARSSWTPVSGVFILPDSVHVIQTGTSIAAAHVAGGLALELQDAKNHTKSLSVEGAKLMLRAAATRDNYFYAVGAADSNQVWGKGKLFLPTTGAVGVADLPSSGLRLAAPFPNPAVGGVTNFQYVLSTEDLASATSVQFDIVDAGGRLVKSMRGNFAAGSQKLTWDGRDEHQRAVRPGMYFARLRVGTKEAVQRFVRIEG